MPAQAAKDVPYAVGFTSLALPGSESTHRTSNNSNSARTARLNVSSAVAAAWSGVTCAANHIQHGTLAPVNTWPRCTAGAGVVARFQWGDWVLRPCPCAYLLTRHDQSRVPSLVRPFGRRQQYYEPLGLPPSTIPFRRR